VSVCKVPGIRYQVPGVRASELCGMLLNGVKILKDLVDRLY